MGQGDMEVLSGGKGAGVEVRASAAATRPELEDHGEVARGRAREVGRGA
jgi:hypothetical protein